MFDYSRNKEEKQDPRAEREEMPVQGTGKYRVMIWDGDKPLLNNRCDTVVVCGFTAPGEITYAFQCELDDTRVKNAAAMSHIAMQLQVASRTAVRQVIKMFPDLTEQAVMEMMRDGVEGLERVYAQQEAEHEDEE